MTWQRATVDAVYPETPSATTLTFSVPGWQGHRPGQHVDLRLTAPDGYTAQRPYSIGSAPATGTLDLTVEATPGGEVSPFLAQMVAPGVTVELRGPLGGWFVWSPEGSGPVQLVGGGSGVVPLMSMLRTHRAVSHSSLMRLLYSVREPAALLFAGELARTAGTSSDDTIAAAVEGSRPSDADEVSILYSRRAPPDHQRPARRLDVRDIAAHTLPPGEEPTCFVCGPTPFVEAVTGLLLQVGHRPDRIRAERFGAGRT